MGAYLDIWDVSHGHAKARLELDELILAKERYEKLRALNPQEFTELCKRNISGEGTFDELVDKL